ncbi:response regulator transcription factor [Paraburkholderia sp.]|uniref:response regulator transcription factor n=1 Tax=Paraburkholderia sp. TaxID=1926495 RepID=UPI0025EF9068|nr:response regulator transcription factor [Paraburkholderia sp.]
MTRVLSVDDDELVAKAIRSSLCAFGHEVDIATTGRDGLAKVMAGSYDVVTLDRVLPDLDGLAVLSTMRSVGIMTPVLLVSAMSAIDERVRSLRAGGDDYLTKPFSADEMAARVDVLARRGSVASSAAPRLVLGALECDLLAHAARFHGRALDMLPTEQRILEYMMRHPGQVLTRTMIFEGVWGYRFDPGTNVIDVHVSRLRNKLAQAGASPAIRTVRGTGYMLSE